MHFSWYRQKLGKRPELLSTIYKYDDPSKVFHWLEKNPRFSVERSEGINHLHISDVQLSDSATYYCGSSYSNSVEFGEGVFLNVEGTNHVELVQEPNSETLQPGSSVTFNCTVDTEACEGGHTVLWYRHGAYQAVLRTHTSQCEITSAQQKSSQACVYHLQKNNLSSSDAGTYYCVVASCGKMLFGSGSELLIRRHAEERLSQTGTFFWLSVFRCGILLLFVIICVCIYIRKSQ
ncbi:basement membrane-specific heparan sulfate proteoglycan core protein-like [Xiphophorus couchianus]|uniref:basement membrane-specific heparan sulfate proteoglycan core protein-like n=1 Tax=Xiphophorus couchianus TaxID=32473 RepID=UPI001017108C|nr:basement membrane-specific heparan sulfate proteoglycan core protein-like [Xiphophorus couchianus]